MDATGIILVGGKNLRYGKNKAFEKISGVTLFERVVKIVQRITDDVVVVRAKKSDILPPTPNLRFIEDEFNETGPLGGIYSGLKAAKYELGLVVATDMPFLSLPLLNHLIGSADNHDIVIPRLKNDMLEALHAVYRKSCLPLMRDQLESGNLQIRLLLCKLDIRYVDEEECRRYDPDLLSFFNINRPADYDLALKIAYQDNS
jgi:molybdopterin-guanine dinucleotide biosynthesis protein A